MLIDVIKEKIFQKTKGLRWKIDNVNDINVEYPKYKKHGDYSTNIALQLSRHYKENPNKIAEIIATELAKDSLFSKVKAAKPGFINFFLSKKHLRNVLLEIDHKKEEYGSQYSYGKGKKVLLEFVSANPTGPLNIVNARAAAFGDTLANILSEVGFCVEKEYYINDAGNQIELLVESIQLELNKLEDINTDEIEEGYKGKYILYIAEELLNEEGQSIYRLPKKALIDKIRKYAIDKILQNQKETLTNFRVNFDSWIYESELREKGSVEDVLTYLSETGCLYEKDDAVWIKSSKYGDKKDRVIMKTDGTPTYLVPDLTYHITKYKRGYDKIIDILGPDHHGHIPRLKAGMKILGYHVSLLDFILLQQVNLLKENKKLKMSKRRGNIVTLQQLIDNVGTDAARFFFLMRKSNTPLDFDIELAKKRSAENPVYYVQYAYARICSIEKQAKAQKIKKKKFKPEYLKRLRYKEEFILMVKLLKFPELLAHIGKTYDVNLITKYLIELAANFHSFYQRCKIVNKKYEELSLARLFLCSAVKTVLKKGLKIMSITAPAKM